MNTMKKLNLFLLALYAIILSSCGVSSKPKMAEDTYLKRWLLCESKYKSIRKDVFANFAEGYLFYKEIEETPFNLKCCEFLNEFSDDLFTEDQELMNVVAAKLCTKLDEVAKFHNSGEWKRCIQDDLYPPTDEEIDKIYKLCQDGENNWTYLDDIIRKSSMKRRGDQWVEVPSKWGFQFPIRYGKPFIFFEKFMMYVPLYQDVDKAKETVCNIIQIYNTYLDDLADKMVSVIKCNLNENGQGDTYTSYLVEYQIGEGDYYILLNLTEDYKNEQTMWEILYEGTSLNEMQQCYR